MINRAGPGRGLANPGEPLRSSFIRLQQRRQRQLALLSFAARYHQQAMRLAKYLSHLKQRFAPQTQVLQGRLSSVRSFEEQGKLFAIEQGQGSDGNIVGGATELL